MTNPSITRMMGNHERHGHSLTFLRLYASGSNSSDRESSTTGSPAAAAAAAAAAADDNERCESHLLPRLYVGRHQESALPFSEYLHTIISSSPSTSTSTSTIPGSSSFQEGTIVPLSPTQAHYVMRVMRMFRKTGRWQFRGHEPCLRLFDGQGDEEWVAQLELLEDDENRDNGGPKKRRKRARTQDKEESSSATTIVVAHCLAKVAAPNNTTPLPLSWHPVLCFAPPKKKERVQWILEKATELGMAAWIPLQTDRGEALIDTTVWEQKGMAHVREAAEQCERRTVPPLLSLLRSEQQDDNMKSGKIDSMAMMQNGGKHQQVYPNPLSVLLGMAEGKNGVNILDDGDDSNYSVSIFVCRERSAHHCAPILEALQKSPTILGDPKQSAHHNNIICLVLVGPEGGWSPAEEAYFDKLAEEYHPRFQNVSLGSNVLRTDTAAVTAMAAFALLQ